MSKNRIYVLTSKNVNKIRTFGISVHCRYCQKEIKFGNAIISKKSGATRMLYHIECAEVLNIV